MGHPGVAQQGLLRIAAAALAIALAGCLFDTRTPETPKGVIKSLARTSPTNVLYNVNSAWAAGSAGIGLYDQQLAQDFAFEMDPADVFEFGSDPFVQWDKEKEKANLGRVFERFGKITLVLNIHAEGVDSLDVDVPVDPTADGEIYFKAASYMIVAATDTSFAGTADVYFRDKGGTWTMFKWADSRAASGSQKSFGLMKASVETS